mmetsp:Transcript_24935/g.83161  ORF Transcript_24935/g.83161 Transcript_24935/m.83161 type:complete len:706 (-) Transcript_24935:376-2493(-)
MVPAPIAGSRMPEDGELPSWPSVVAAGLDPAPLGELCQELRSLATELGLPGYTLAISKAGRRAFLEASGPMSLQRPEREVDVNTLFRLFSMTKAIVSVALMTFYDEGRFDLDDPIADFLGDAWRAAAPDDGGAGCDRGGSVSTTGLRVAASDGIVRGTPGEDPEEQVVGPKDAAFLFCSSTNSHLDIDPKGTCCCRWNDAGEWQTLRVEPLAPGYVALKSHTGRYLDVDDGRVLACAEIPVAWMLRITPSHVISSPPSRQSLVSDIRASGSGSSLASTPSNGSASGELTAGAHLRLRHQASGLWAHVSAEEADAANRFVSTTPDVATASVFVLEKQTWRVPELDSASRDVTIRHLLTHTSGLNYAGQAARPTTALDALVRPLILRCESGEVTTLEEWTAEMAKLPLRCQPGSRFQYGYSTDVVGRIVEVLAEAPLDVALRRRVLEPLRMTSTTFAAAAGERLASLYKLSGDPSRPPELLDESLDENGSQWVPPRGPAPVLGGGGGVEGVRGGLLSTTSDYMSFCHMLLGKGQLNGVRVLKESTVELMTEVNHLGLVLGDPSATIGSGDCRGWGLLGGIELPTKSLSEDPGHNPGTYGWGGWASTIFRVNPASGVCFVFMTNCVGAEERVEKLILRRVGEAVRNGGKGPSTPLQLLWGLLSGSRPSGDASATVAGTVAAAAVLSALLAAGLAARRGRLGGGSAALA